MSSSRWVTALAATAALAGETAAPAVADSLSEHNVWIAYPDGSGRQQVTRDGTAAAPYTSPSQADDGTVVALREAPGQRPRIYRMRQNGALLNPPVDTPAPGTGAIDAKVSPDGSLVAYWFVTGVNPGCAFCVRTYSQVLISHADRFTNVGEVGTPNTGGWPSWVSRDTLAIGTGSASQWYYRLGMREAAEWFADSDFVSEGFATLSDADVAPRGDRLAVVRGNHRESLLLLRLNGGPPTKPSVANASCTALHGSTFHEPTWSADGRTLAWQEPDGVWTMPVPDDLTDCAGFGEPVLRFPGASAPDLSPASIAPGPPAPCGNPGNPECPPPGPTCERPDGCVRPEPDGTRAALTKRVRALSKRVATALGKRTLRSLRRAGRHTVAFRAPSAGTLTLTLKASKGKRALMRAGVTFRRAGKRSFTLKLTAAGRRRLREARRLRASLSARFVADGATVRATRRVDLRR
jgi:catechol 2,3-dioxygenase-like lactoylglutathione lyase family enzyme